MGHVPNSHFTALDAAYEAGHKAAKSGEKTQADNPYGYRIQNTLYWEWMRGFREFMFGKGNAQ